MKRTVTAVLLLLAMLSSPLFAGKKQNPGFFQSAMRLLALYTVTAQLTAAIDTVLASNSGDCKTQTASGDFLGTCDFNSSQVLAFENAVCPPCEATGKERIFINFDWHERTDCCKHWRQYGDPHGEIETGEELSVITCDGKPLNGCSPQKAACVNQKPLGMQCKWTGKKKGPCEAPANSPLIEIWGASDSSGEVKLKVREVIGRRSNIDEVYIDSVDEGQTAKFDALACDKMNYNGTDLDISSKKVGDNWIWTIVDSVTKAEMQMSCMPYGAINIDKVSSRGETSGFMATGKFNNQFDALVRKTPSCPGGKAPMPKFVPPFLPSKLVAFADLPDNLDADEAGFLIQYKDEKGDVFTVKGVPQYWGIDPNNGPDRAQFPELFENPWGVVPHIPAQEFSDCPSWAGAAVSIVLDNGEGTGCPSRLRRQ